MKINLTLRYDDDLDKVLIKKFPKHEDYRIISESLDARGSNRGKIPQVHYIIDVINSGEKFEEHIESFKKLDQNIKPPLIIGAGPAGLFCALRLAEYGIPSLIFERGDRATKRMKSIARFWRYGEFDSENNVCFGEGGAGLFSDGKLMTRVKSPFINYVMKKMVDFGAPKEIAYKTNPHLGSNKIRQIITLVSDFLKSKGCTIFYNCKVSKLLYENGKVIGLETSTGEKYFSDSIVLATGHSAADIYRELKTNKVAMKGKDFSVGVRIEHSRKLINSLQFGKFSGEEKLGTARYNLKFHNKETARGTYSFCMCPGGYVLSSGTDADGIVVNGMSNSAHNSPWSNAALVVSIKNGEDFNAEEDILNGLHYQREIEKRAYLESKKLARGIELPAMSIRDFLDGQLNSEKLPITSSPSKVVKTNLHQILPSVVTEHLIKGLEKFERNIEGFTTLGGVLIAPETRTSAPVTIERSIETLQSPSHVGLYPCGEGAGHAGGITSAAVDGVKVAEAIVQIFQ